MLIVATARLKDTQRSPTAATTTYRKYASRSSNSVEDLRHKQAKWESSYDVQRGEETRSKCLLITIPAAAVVCGRLRTVDRLIRFKLEI